MFVQRSTGKDTSLYKQRGIWQFAMITFVNSNKNTGEAYKIIYSFILTRYQEYRETRQTSSTFKN